MIELGAGARFLDVGNVFAQVVDGDGNAFLVEFGSDSEDILHLRARDKAARESLPDGGFFGCSAQAPAF